MEFEVAVQGVQQLLEMGGNGAAMLICYFLYKLDRRVHNLELVTGVKKLIQKAG